MAKGGSTATDMAQVEPRHSLGSHKDTVSLQLTQQVFIKGLLCAGAAAPFQASSSGIPGPRAHSQLLYSVCLISAFTEPSQMLSMWSWLSSWRGGQGGVLEAGVPEQR
jgi:hypothetical protein